MPTLNHRGSYPRVRQILGAVAVSAATAALTLVSPLVPAAVAGPPDSVSIAADVKVGSTGSDPTGLLDMGGTVYFAATQGDRELWKSSGSGASLVRDINAGAGSSDPRELTRSSESVFFFSATGFGGRELWRSNGTTSGTAQVGEVNAGTASSAPTELTMVGSTLFFSAFDGTDRELWKTNGTLAGTVQVKDIMPGAGSGDPQDLIQVGGTLFFTAVHAGPASRELWKSDGTAAGTVRVKDIYPGTDGSFPLDLTAIGPTVYFSALDGPGAHELWKSDGTAAGTVLIKESTPRRPSELTNVSGTLFFTGDGAAGRELWKSNGTAAGTVLVKDIVIGTQISGPTELSAVGGRLFFQAGPDANRELWTSNGTPAGTVRVKEISAAGSSSPSELTDVAGVAYFSATDDEYGREVWRSDGTVAGTARVGDIAAGTASGAPTYLTVSGGQLFMSAEDSVHGRELWHTTDTTPPNTSITSGPDEGSTTMDAPITLGFASSDVPSTFQCRFSAVEPGQESGQLPAFGQCSTASSHTLTPDPAPGSRVTVEVRATDAAGNVDPTPASRTFSVVPSDARPVAVDDAITVQREIDLPAALDVLANDTDTDGGPIQIESITQPVNGSVQIVDSGSRLSYEPSRQYCNDSGPFTYTLNGGSTATVNVTVLCGDSPPVAFDDDISVIRGAGPSLLDVLANDRNPDGGPIRIESVGHPRNGSVQIVDSGSRLAYEPDRNLCNDSGPFTYTLNGGSTATISVRVICESRPIDQTPVAVDDSASVSQNAEPTSIDVLANDTDPDGGPMVVESVTQAANGTVEITGSGSGLAYAPSPDYCNDGGDAQGDQRSGPPETFSYTLNGGSTATVTVGVTCELAVDEAPVAADDAASMPEDAEPTSIDVLANDTDPDGGPMVVESVTQAANGTVEITGSGSGLTYAPNPGYCSDPGSPDTFTYTLNRGSTATVEVTVTCADEPPPADTAAPQTVITTAPNLLEQSLWLAKRGSFAFTSDEPGSTFECRVDQGVFAPCTSPHALTLPFGSHTFEVRAIDQAGNVDPTPAVRRVLVLGLL